MIDLDAQVFRKQIFKERKIAMITKEELNPSLQAFLRNDWDFKSYIAKRTESNEDLNLIHDVLTNDGDTSRLPENKQVMNQMFKTPDAKVQEMVKMASESDLLAYVGTKVCTKMYDTLINDKMNQEHQIENKPQSEITEKEQRKLNQLPFKMGIQVNRMAKRVTDEFETAVAIIRAMAKANDGTPSRDASLDVSKMIDIASKSNTMLARILKLVGHFQGCFDHKLRTKSDAIENLCGIKLGNEIPNLLPSEMMMMMDKDFESLKTLDFIKRNTMQYKFKGKSPKTDGPIVCCIDESASMSGERIELAKAFCFGLFQQAKKENREFQIIRFGRARHCEIASIKNGNDLLEVSSKFFNDRGTNFETPLNMAMDVIHNDSKFDKADIVMITDGESDIDQKFIDKFMNFKNQTNTKLITMSIERWFYDGGLGKISDTVVFGADFDRLVDLV